MAVYGYARVSTNEQAADDRCSIDEQKRRILGGAMVRGEEIAEMFVDAGVSGGMPLKERPCGKEMSEMLEPGDVVIASKMDRLFRCAQDALNMADWFRKNDVSLVLMDMGTDPVNSNGASKLFFTMLAAMAEWERGRIAERMADGRAGKKARGGLIGGSAPYGFKTVGRGRAAMLEEVEAEQRVIAAAKELRGQDWPYGKIAQELETRGMVSRNGKPFEAMQVMRMVKNAD